MFSTKDGEPVAIVKGGKANGEIIFINTKTQSDTCLKDNPSRSISVQDGSFEQLPSPNVRIIYIAAPSGAGKSFYSASYIKKYIKLHFPKGERTDEQIQTDPHFYLFSRLDADKVLDDLKPIRVKVDESCLKNPFDIREIQPNSMVLFDDIDCITNPKIQACVNLLKEQIMDLGRHTNIKCVVTSHLINGKDKNATRTLLNEMQSLTIFPKAGSAYQIRYALKHYFGLSATQINKILAIDSRWVTILKSYPQCLISEHQLMFISELEGQRAIKTRK